MAKTLVIGASSNPERYSFKAINRLLTHKHEVVALGLKSDKVASVTIITDYPVGESIDTITLYLNARRQAQYYLSILDTKPRRVIFNPGTENEEFANLLRTSGIEAIEACTLVMLNTDQY